MTISEAYIKLDKKSFEALFREYFVPLCSYARKFIYDMDSSKEIVQDVYINLWEKRDTIEMDKSVKSYLYTSVHNRCLNHIRDNKKFDKGNIRIEHTHYDREWVDNDKLVEAENENKIMNSINSLPQKCREIFILSRFEQLKYNEIAEKTGISVKTVEAQMSKALKLLRENLSEFLVIFLIFIIQFLINF
ncbi:MAG: RNA polymerase sigma-70 factor [Bacteroidota bacterium]